MRMIMQNDNVNCLKFFCGDERIVSRNRDTILPKKEKKKRNRDTT